MTRTRYIKLIIGFVFLASLLVGQVVQADGISTTQLWVGEYFNNTTRTGTPVFTRIDYDLNFDWGTGSPSTSLGYDNFSARWTSTVTLPAGTYRFWVRADDQISVIVDGQAVINTFTNNVVDQLVTGDIVLGSGQHNMLVEYREYVGPAFVYFDYANLSNGETGPDFVNPVSPTPTGQWVVSYYANPNLIGNPVGIFSGQAPQGDWGSGAPIASLPDDEWSARYEANLLFNGATYIMRAQADDGVRVYIDQRLIIDEWHIARATTYTSLQTLSAGLHHVVVEYFESGGTASLNFSYELSADYIPPLPEGSTGYLGTVTIATGRLNVRDEPNPFTGEILTKVSNGETYGVVAFNPSQTWVQIDVNGVIGWVNSAYVAFNTDTSATVNSQYTVTAEPYTVNIRSGPGTQYSDIGNFDAGDSAEVIGRNAASTWWQINYDGIVGWVTARYAIIQSFAEIENIPITG